MKVVLSSDNKRTKMLKEELISQNVLYIYIYIYIYIGILQRQTLYINLNFLQEIVSVENMYTLV